MRLLFVWCLGLTTVLTATDVRAELTAEEVALLAMADSAEGRELAEYYAEARGVPEGNLCLLPGKPVHTIDRAEFESSVLPVVREWLEQNGRRERIRCLVACWDVPLRVGKQSTVSGASAKRIEFFEKARAALIERVGKLFAELDQVAAGDGTPERTPPKADARFEELAAQLDAALKAAQQRSRALEDETERREANRTLEGALLTGSGIAGAVRLAAASAASQQLSAEQAARVGSLRGRAVGLTEGIQAMSRLPESVARDTQLLVLVARFGGMLGAIRWVDEQQELLRKNETYSSFDSELSMLYWPEYSLFRWQPNALHYRWDRPASQHPQILMVARLAAPSLDRTKQLIDGAIATEKEGLQGKFYVDARGIRFDPDKGKSGSYGQYDQSLRDLVERLQDHTELEVVFDNEAALFQPGNCPDAALYCGWYSLAKYIDAFDWAPGAVGYHIASSEATTLRKPGGKVWCNAMLEDGITATLGPVHEPYLAAFPLPDDFFPLLLTGKYTLVEVYYRTKPFNSWAMVLVGDPLYSPFKIHPALAEEHLPERMRGRTDDLLAAPGGAP